MALNKVGIVYDGKNGQDWSIRAFGSEFEKRGVQVYMLDINTVGNEAVESPQDVYFPRISKVVDEGCKIWLNRVYPSDSDFSNIRKVLSLTPWLNERGCTTVNSLTACTADYDKFFAYEIMEGRGILVPKTEKIRPDTSPEDYLDEFGLPVVIKRNTGGRGIGVVKVSTEEELAITLKLVHEKGREYLIQEFIRPLREFDVRVGVIDGQPLISYGRTLVGEGEPWMGSCNHGSEIIDYDATDEEKGIAVAASSAIGAILNETDIHITERGPVVIENNPTPGYDKGEEKWVELIVNHIIWKYRDAV